MASSLSTAPFFKNPDFSDITIKFSGREVKCHKIILCNRSEYFRTLCGPNSKFVESEAREVELKEDDPDAVEAVLRYIYTGDTTPADPHDWLYQLEVSKAATKYLAPALEAAAFQQFCATTDQLTDTNAVWHAINKIREIGDQAKHAMVADKLEENHQSALLRNEEYRKTLENDKELFWHVMDRFNFTHDVKEYELRKCSKCNKSFVRLIGSEWVPEKCPTNRDYNCRPVDFWVRSWMSQKETETFNARR